MKDVSSLINTMQEMGNPFSEDSQDLIALDSKQIIPKEVIDFVKGAKMVGQDQYELFVTESAFPTIIVCFWQIKTWNKVRIN